MIKRLKHWRTKFRCKYNFYTDAQKKHISTEYVEFIAESKRIAQDIETSSREFTKTKLNGTCPKCQNTDIVDKIARTHGSGSVRGGGMLGFNHVEGSSRTDTDPVSHCNGCGHQWKKYGYDYTYEFEITKRFLEELCEHIINGVEMSDWRLKRVENITAEGIWMLISASSYRHYGIMSKMTLPILREKYKTIYDE